MDKINLMSTGEKIIVGAAVLLLLDSFIFAWYSVDFGFASVSVNAWEAPGAIWSILAVIVGVVLAGAILAPKFANVQLPELPANLTLGQFYLGGGALAFAFLVLKFINESSYVAIGFWLGFLLTAAMALGGYMIYTEEKGTQPFWNSRR